MCTMLNMKAATDGGELQYRGLILEPASFSVTLCRQPLLLTKREFEILWHMLSVPPGRVFTRRELSECGLGGGTGGKKDSVYVHICHIRKKIRKITEEEYIETIRGYGFRLVPS